MSASPLNQAYRPPQADDEEPAHDEPSDFELRDRAARIAGTLLLASVCFDAAAQLVSFVMGRRFPWFELFVNSGCAWVAVRLWRRGLRWRSGALLLFAFLTEQALERAYPYMNLDAISEYKSLVALVFLAVLKTPPIALLLLGSPGPARVRIITATFTICQLASFALSARQLSLW